MYSAHSALFAETAAQTLEDSCGRDEDPNSTSMGSRRAWLWTNTCRVHWLLEGNIMHLRTQDVESLGRRVSFAIYAPRSCPITDNRTPRATPYLRKLRRWHPTTLYSDANETPSLRLMKNLLVQHSSIGVTTHLSRPSRNRNDLFFPIPSANRGPIRKETPSRSVYIGRYICHVIYYLDWGRLLNTNKASLLDATPVATPSKLSKSTTPSVVGQPVSSLFTGYFDTLASPIPGVESSNPVDQYEVI
ncbi:hypothetical protein BDY19DRAFT_909970 [Irpex rosettiformis]|uniref:Uncharacterized protein n=1 Tax=Irpex rosettiformis TaxID=378272 RepID=A0ACB8TQB7_9APHY|nr:hypothetical protein BDY19DRAFT_909970 [Irpex rosettiformis]